MFHGRWQLFQLTYAFRVACTLSIFDEFHELPQLHMLLSATLRFLLSYTIFYVACVFHIANVSYALQSVDAISLFHKLPAATSYYQRFAVVRSCFS